MNVDLPSVDIDRILYVTDLSDNARYAMAYAVSLANTYCAQIIILHVIDEAPKVDEDRLRPISGPRTGKKSNRPVSAARRKPARCSSVRNGTIS